MININKNEEFLQITETTINTMTVEKIYYIISQYNNQGVLYTLIDFEINDNWSNKILTKPAITFNEQDEEYHTSDLDELAVIINRILEKKGNYQLQVLFMEDKI